MSLPKLTGDFWMDMGLQQFVEEITLLSPKKGDILAIRCTPGVIHPERRVEQVEKLLHQVLGYHVPILVMDGQCSVAILTPECRSRLTDMLLAHSNNDTDSPSSGEAA